MKVRVNVRRGGGGVAKGIFREAIHGVLYPNT